MSRSASLLTGAGVIVIATAITVVAIRRNDGQGERSSTRPDPAASTDRAVSGGEAGDSREPMTLSLFRQIARRENPMVVAITTQSRIASPDISQFFGGNDFFNQFFGGPAQPRVQPREQFRRALGSGFLISAEGEIVTNNHVVAGAEQIRVALFNDEHKTYQAEVLGRDALTDSALLKLKDAGNKLPTARLGDSNSLEAGDWVLAIGNPFQLGHTVTVGVISYKGRPFATTEGRFQNMLQTDASINPGNSGGPLLNERGEVVGVNSAIVSGSGGNIGIGFAVPINTVKELLPQLRTGTVHRGELGVQILSTPISDEEAKSLGLPTAAGAIVSRVAPDSPAERAGLQAGDVIVEYDGKPVSNADQLTSLVIASPAGAHVRVAYYRNAQRQTADVTIGELKVEEEATRAEASRGDVAGFGLTLGDLTADIRSQLQLPAGTQGILVENVEPFTPAASAGLRRGDVIVQINRHDVHSAQEAIAELRAVKSGQPAFLMVLREGVRMFVELRKE
jgi:serine protease Do